MVADWDIVACVKYAAAHLNMPPPKCATAHFKGALSGLKQFLATESPLKGWKMLFLLP